MISGLLSGYIGWFLRPQNRFPRSDLPPLRPPSFLNLQVDFGDKISENILQVCSLSSQEFEAMLEFGAFYARPAAIRVQRNIALPPRASLTFWFYMGSCKQTLSLPCRVSLPLK